MKECDSVADHIIPIEAGRLGLSRITYHTDLQRSAGLVIPLGVVAELLIGPWWALGLIARTTLATAELNAIGRMCREDLSSPLNFLAPDFDWAFSEARPGEALHRLSRRLSDSVFCAPPSIQLIKKPLALGAPAAELLLTELRKVRDAEYYLMLAEADGTPAAPSEDRTKLRTQRAA